MTYRLVKKVVLSVLLASLFFFFGMLFGPKMRDRSTADPSSGGPPAPVMRQIQALKDRIAKNPKDSDAYSNLGDMYFQARKYDQALALYQKAVELNGKDVVSRNDLAICYHLAGQDPQAFQQLDAALKLSPQSQHLWLTLGVISYESGNKPQAKSALEKAAGLNPNSAAGAEAKKTLAVLSRAK